MIRPTCFAAAMAAGALLTLPRALALDFSFSELSCSRMAYKYTLASNWEAKATDLIVNYKDETIAVIEVEPGKRSGAGAFDSNIITEAGAYDFSVTLASDDCDLLAPDGSCYVDGRTSLFALKISQRATCAENGGQGTNDADATLSAGAQDAVASAADASAATQGIVPDAALSTLAFITTVTKAPAAPTAAAAVSQSSTTSRPAAPLSANSANRLQLSTLAGRTGLASLLLVLALTLSA